MIHTSLWASEQVAKLSVGARLLYIGLITLGDDDGRLKGSPALLRSQLFPYDDQVKVSDVEKWLKEIEVQKLIIGYCVEEGCFYYHPKWEMYQHIREDRRKESNIPAPTFDFPDMSTGGQPSGNQKATKRPHSIVKDSIVKDSIDKDVAFAAFWEKYPRKVSKKAAYKAWQKIKLDDALIVRIMSALSSAMKSEQWVKDAGRYIPHAATWLNGERWEDEMAPSKIARSNKYDAVGTTVRA